MQARKAAPGAAFLFLLGLAAAAHADLAAGKRKAQARSACHGPDGNPASAQPPALAAQTARSRDHRPKAFKARTRTNDAGSMTSVAQTISEQDIEDLAHYISTLD